MDGQSPRQPVNADVVPRQQGVRSVNLLNCLVFGPGQKGQRGQTLGFRGVGKVKRVSCRVKRGQEWSKGQFDLLGGLVHGFFAFSESIQLRFSRVSSQFRLSRRSGSNRALRFSCRGSGIAVMLDLSRIWMFGGVLGCEGACS